MIFLLCLESARPLVLSPSSGNQTIYRYPLYVGKYGQYARLEVLLTIQPDSPSRLPCCKQNCKNGVDISKLTPAVCKDGSKCVPVYSANFSFKEFIRESEAKFECLEGQGQPQFNLNSLRPVNYSLCMRPTGLVQVSQLLSQNTTGHTEFKPEQFSKSPQNRLVNKVESRFWLGDSCAEYEPNYLLDLVIALGVVGVGWLLTRLCLRGPTREPQIELSQQSGRQHLPFGGEELMPDEQQFEGSMYRPRRLLIEQDMQLIRKQVLQ